MKKFVLYISAIMLICLMLGILIVGNARGINLKTKEVNDTKQIVLKEGIKLVKVEAISEEIKISRVTNSEIVARIHGKISQNSSDVKIKVEQSDDEISISIDRSRGLSFFSDLGPLEISLPEKYTGELSLKTVSGDIDLENANNLNGLKAKTVSGDVAIEKISSKIEAETVSGEISLILEKIAGYIDIHSTSGDIEVSLPKEPSVRISFRTVSGYLKNDFGGSLSKVGRHDFEGKIGDGEHDLSVKTVSGDLRLGN